MDVRCLALAVSAVCTPRRFLTFKVPQPAVTTPAPAPSAQSTPGPAAAPMFSGNRVHPSPMMTLEGTPAQAHATPSALAPQAAHIQAQQQRAAAAQRQQRGPPSVGKVRAV